MKKILLSTMVVTFSLTSSLMAIEQCNEWFQKNDFGIVGTMGKSGTGVVLDKNGEMTKVFASGTTSYDFKDNDEISEALSESNLIAKANLAKFLKEEITSEDTVSKISSRKKTLSKDGNGTNIEVIKKIVKTQTMSISSHTQALLTGIIKVCESHDEAKKEVQVVLAVSPKTTAAASKAANMINKEIGSRKSVEEYSAERKAAEGHSNSVKTGSVNSSGGETSTGSYSNKAKNMDF